VPLLSQDLLPGQVSLMASLLVPFLMVVCLW